MPIDPQLWQAMFSLDTIPLCNEGMELAEVFLATCGQAVENATVSDQRVLVLAAWNKVSEHANICGKCREL